MRLFEYENNIPDFRRFITPALVDEIINTGKWVEHGADLEDWIQGSCYATDNWKHLGFDEAEAERFEQLPYEEQRQHPYFRKCIEDWLPRGCKQFTDNLLHGDKFHKLPPFGPNSKLYRCMTVDAEWLNSSAPKFGVFWSAVPEQAQRFLDGSKAGPKVIMMVRAGNVGAINWYATFRSRLDYSNGCDEEEFQLERGTPIENVHIKMVSTGEVIVKSGTA